MSAPAEDGWRRLDRRLIHATALVASGVAAGLAISIMVRELAQETSAVLVFPLAALGVLVVGAGGALVGWVAWRRTQYRVTAERVELRSAIITRKYKSIPRDRVRSVDLTANLLYRLLGVVKVEIGTGQHTRSGEQLVVEPVVRADADRLRAELLHGPVEPATSEAAPDMPAAPVAGATGIAVLDWNWLRFAPVSVTTPLLGAAAFGTVLQFADYLGLQEALFDEAGDQLRGTSIIMLVLVVAVLGIASGVTGSLLLFIVQWFGYRLDREPGGMLRMQRGLLTTRSLSLRESRIRGVELIEPLGARLLRGARLDVVASGLRTTDDKKRGNPKTLLPAAPMAEVGRVAAEVLREPVAPADEVRLTPHPVAARGKRLRWALASALVPVVALVVSAVLFDGPFWWLAAVVFVLGGAIGTLLALDAYRNLGHGLTERHLVARHGSASRHTVALRRSGIIGFTIRQSVFQRRAGLLTVGVTTAANTGEYLVYDVAEDEGLAFAAEAVPGLLTPFLQGART